MKSHVTDSNKNHKTPYHTNIEVLAEQGFYQQVYFSKEGVLLPPAVQAIASYEEIPGYDADGNTSTSIFPLELAALRLFKTNDGGLHIASLRALAKEYKAGEDIPVKPITFNKEYAFMLLLVTHNSEEKIELRISNGKHTTLLRSNPTDRDAAHEKDLPGVIAAGEILIAEVDGKPIIARITNKTGRLYAHLDAKYGNNRDWPLDISTRIMHNLLCSESILGLEIAYNYDPAVDPRDEKLTADKVARLEKIAAYNQATHFKLSSSGLKEEEAAGSSLSQQSLFAPKESPITEPVTTSSTDDRSKKLKTNH